MFRKLNLILMQYLVSLVLYKILFFLYEQALKKSNYMKDNKLSRQISTEYFSDQIHILLI